MKKIFTLSTLFVGLALVLSSCYKRVDQVLDENYWLSQERGIVVYSSNACSYYVVESYNGYSIIRSRDGYMPYEGSTVYGNFSGSGSRDIYNYSSRTLMFGNVVEYWLDYYDAQDAIDYYCGYYGKGTNSEKKMINKAGISKK